MTETTHYKLKKPGVNEAYTVNVPNENADAVDAALHLKADLDPATGKLKKEQLDLPELDFIPTSEKGTPNGVATLDKDGHVVEAQIPGGLADEAVEEHDKADGVHANMNFVTFREGAPVPPVPVNADLLEHKTKAEVSAEILAAMDASLAPDKAKWNAKADLFGPVTVTVPLEGWTGTGPWVQTVSVAGVTAADEGLTLCPVDLADDAARKLYEKAYGCLAVQFDTVDGGAMLTCRSAKPETAFQVIIKGVR